MDTATVTAPPTIEWGIRHDATGQITHWGKWDHLALSDPKDYPGYTIVTREVSAWATPTQNDSEARIWKIAETLAYDRYPDQTVQDSTDEVIGVCMPLARQIWADLYPTPKEGTE